jgi:hypothetical protein
MGFVCFSPVLRLTPWASFFRSFAAYLNISIGWNCAILCGREFEKINAFVNSRIGKANAEVRLRDLLLIWEV